MTNVGTINALPLVNRENPWPGLASFDEQSAAFFFGRNEEATELLRMVKREILTVLSGQSGLGKTSLLQAGLFPRLRQEDYLPVLIRLDHSASAPPLAEQIKSTIHREVTAGQIDAPAPRPGQTLWEYFHQKERDFWSPRNKLLTPVLILDQFEEIFTLGRASEAARLRGRQLALELADLIKNNVPESIEKQIEDDEARAAAFIFEEAAVRVVLSLREDFIGQLKGLESELGSILHNWMPLYPMTGAQAFAAITGPGGNLVDEQVGQQIVRFVAGMQGEPGRAAMSADELKALRVAPSLLSMICRELNEKRIRQGLSKITPDLVAGNRSEILDRFYEQCMKGLPPAARAWVEDSLLTPSGYRDSEAWENAAGALSGPVLEKLISRRLLRIDDRGDSQRVELTHDILAAPVKNSRDQRRQREELQRVAVREKEARAKLAAAHRRMEVLGVVGAIVLVFGVVSFLEWRNAARQTELARVAEVQANTAKKDAEQAKTEAEKQRDVARSALAMAESAKNDAVAAKSDAEKQRDLARGAEQKSEDARKEAEQAKADVEKQRDLARASEERASARFGDVKEFANEIIFDVYEKMVDIPGSGDAANLMLNTSLSYLKKLQADSGNDPTVAREMLVAYNRLGVMAERSGNTEDASKSYHLAMDIAQRLDKLDPKDTDAHRDLAICYDHLGDVLVKNDDAKRALEQYQAGFAIWDSLAKTVPGNGAQQDLGVSYDLLGGVLHELRDDKGALEKFKKGLEICEALVKLDPEDDGFQRNLAVSYEHVGRSLWRSGDNKGALEQYKKSFAINEKLARAEPASMAAQRSLAISYDNIGDVLADERDSKGALDQYQKSYEIWDRLARSDRGNAQVQRDLAISLDHLGDMMASANNVTGALEQYQKSLDIRERLARLDPTNIKAQRDLAMEYSTLGDSLSENNQSLDALDPYRKSLAIWEEIQKVDPTNADTEEEIATCYDHIGQALLDSRDARGALEAFRKEFDIEQKTARANPQDKGAQRELAVAYGRIGGALEAMGDKPGARQQYDLSLAIRQKLVDQQPESASAKKDLQYMEDRIEALDKPATQPAATTAPALTQPATTEGK